MTKEPVSQTANTLKLISGIKAIQGQANDEVPYAEIRTSLEGLLHFAYSLIPDKFVETASEAQPVGVEATDFIIQTPLAKFAIWKNEGSPAPWCVDRLNEKEQEVEHWRGRVTFGDALRVIVPTEYVGYCGPSGTHVYAILKALANKGVVKLPIKGALPSPSDMPEPLVSEQSFEDWWDTYTLSAKYFREDDEKETARSAWMAAKGTK
jgi:hypothetical protein